MTDDELAAIHARYWDWYHEDDPPSADWSNLDQDEDMSHCIVREDVPLLLAEVVRLRAQLADAWHEGYRNGYAIGFRDDPDALIPSQNPYETPTGDTVAVPRASVEAARVAVQRDQQRGRDSDPDTIRLANATTQTGNKT